MNHIYIEEPVVFEIHVWKGGFVPDCSAPLVHTLGLSFENLGEGGAVEVDIGDTFNVCVDLAEIMGDDWDLFLVMMNSRLWRAAEGWAESRDYRCKIVLPATQAVLFAQCCRDFFCTIKEEVVNE